MNIWELTALELKGSLASGELSSLEIVDALIARSATVDPVVHGFVHRFWDSARDHARRCDDERAQGKVRGALHGLPFTVKESIDTTGTATTLGYLSQLEHRPEHDAVMVRLLRAQGAIVLGKTNVPQTLLVGMETDNHIWGKSVNPWSRRHAPGGSSGGEAVALATGQSPLGIGTDLGGSLRLPAHFCGVASLKPTGNRWSNAGCRPALAGQEVVRSQVGPMARTARDVALLFNAIAPSDMARWDPSVPPLPAVTTEEQGAIPLGALRIGCYTDDGVFAPSASVCRAVEEATAILERAGATIVPYSPPNSEELTDLFFAALTADGGTLVGELLGNEVPIPQLAITRRLVDLPRAVRHGLATITTLGGDAQVGRILRHLGAKSAAELWKLAARRTVLRREELAAWNVLSLDTLVCPVHMTAASPHGGSAEFSAAGAFSTRYNVLDFPAGTVPVTRVTEHETQPTPRAPRDKFARIAERIEAASLNLPVGVQVVGRPYQEETVLAVMHAIEQEARSRPSFPWTPVTP